MVSSSRGVRLPPMPRISDIIRLYGLTAKKQLSQNFILDLNVTDKIARKADVFDAHVCEVGAGPGSITRSILQAGVRHLAAVEIDKRFLPVLEQLADCAEGHMSIHNEDIRRCDIPRVLPNAKSVPWDADDDPGVRLVGNLPFSVSIPLLLQWLEAIHDKKGPFVFGRVPMTLVFQKEVAEIDAWLVNIVPRKHPQVDAPFRLLEQIVKAVFQHRRKVIRTPLKLLFPERENLVDDLLYFSRVDGRKRAHQLSMDDYDRLCNTFTDLCNKHGLEKTPLKVRRPAPVVDQSTTASSLTL